jgi:glyoxylase-like metal-dependent hydrolase (beta-lactamase superfamily II)
MIEGLSPAMFNFEPEELVESDLANRSYLVVHPDGTLQFDAGALPDSAFEGNDGRVVDGMMWAELPLATQLEAAGFQPDDIDYFALSHYHSDHTANANLFANATWIVQRDEYDYMFSGDTEGIMAVETFAELEHADIVMLDDEDYDVFGDGRVMIMSAPGHTPGHQVVAVRLDKAGWIVLGGDLYHYPEERTTGRTPSFEFDREISLASRARIEDFLTSNDATLWIEHDLATHASLPAPPGYVD